MILVLDSKNNCLYSQIAACYQETTYAHQRTLKSKRVLEVNDLWGDVLLQFRTVT